MRNTLKPRPPRESRSSVSASPVGEPTRFSQVSQIGTRGVKRPPSPFRSTPSSHNRYHPRTRSIIHSSHSASSPAKSMSRSTINKVDLAYPDITIQDPTTISREHSHTLPPSGRFQDNINEIPGAEEDHVSDDEEDTYVVMAVDYRGKRLGCSFYTAQDETLWFVNDIQISMSGASAAAGKDLFEGIKFQIQPTIVLFPARADELFLTGDGTASLNSISAESLSIRPAPEFSVEQGKNKLANLNLGSDQTQKHLLITPDNTDLEATFADEGFGFDPQPGIKQNLLRLESYIDADSNWVSVGCAGALLTHLRRKRAIMNPYDEDGVSKYGVSKVKFWTMQDTMFINVDTMTSLQIFNDESHPSFHRQGEHGRGTEGLSLFGIINSTSTPQGYQCLKQTFLRPSLDVGVITSRHNAIYAFTRPDNSNAVGGILKALKKMPDIAKTLATLKKGGANCATGELGDLGIGGSRGRRPVSTGTWGALRNFSYNAIQVKSFVTEMIGAQEIELFQKVVDRFEVMHLQNVGKLIDDTVDFEESKYQGRVCVKSGVSMTLDSMKHTYNGLEALLSQVAENILNDVPSYIQDTGFTLNVVYFPQLGYLICIPKDDAGHALYAGPEDDEEGEYKWEWMFGTDESVYFKNYQMNGLDSEIGDIFGLICDKEIDILHDLQEKVMRYDDILLTCSNICGELDSILAMAQATTKFSLVRPHMTEDNVIKIRNGRHILQELCVSTFIPNNTELEGGAGHDPENMDSVSGSNDTLAVGKSMMIATGPNYSGKSVYLKQVPLIVYMAHIGCYVPAESATIGLTDAILTRIQTRESVSKTQSAFMIDLQQIASALRLASRRTLLVIDEFGKGTESTDGAGLACAVAEHLLDLGAEAPKTLIATHYHEIFENGFLASHPSLKFGHMKILLDQSADSAENQITYLYTLENGRSTSSFGTVCAAMNGVDKDIVDRAEELIVKMAKGEDIANICAVMSAREAREFAYAEHVARRFMQLEFEDQVPEDGNEAGDGMENTKAALEKIFDGRLA